MQYHRINIIFIVMLEYFVMSPLEDGSDAAEVVDAGDSPSAGTVGVEAASEDDSGPASVDAIAVSGPAELASVEPSDGISVEPSADEVVASESALVMPSVPASVELSSVEVPSELPSLEDVPSEAASVEVSAGVEEVSLPVELSVDPSVEASLEASEEASLEASLVASVEPPSEEVSIT